jgi:hypothetical protein
MKGIFGVMATKRMRSRLNCERSGMDEVIFAKFLLRKIGGILRRQGFGKKFLTRGFWQIYAMREREKASWIDL